MDGVQALESHVDSAIRRLCNELGNRFIDLPNLDAECDLGECILFCEFHLPEPTMMVTDPGPQTPGMSLVK